jgi:GNAT superfamily N-acetyltransferase
MSEFSTLDLVNGLDYLDLFLDDMESKWLAKGGGPGLKDSLIEKAVTCKEGGKVRGVILCHEEKPVGISWVEKTTKFYGNIVFHSLENKYDEKLADTVCDNKFFDDSLLEVVIVDLDSPVMQRLRDLGLVENKRQRMSFWLEGTPEFQQVFTDIEFRQITEEDKHYTGTLSYTTHQISKDYEMYPEMTIFDLRKKLEDHLYNKGYGPIVKEASLVASLNGMPLGYIMIVEVNCWGFDKMPWIFDVCVKPDFHGKGLGRALLFESINQLIKLKYSVLGLAVTGSNSAIHLYEKTGFQLVDHFSEFLQICTPELYPRYKK